MTRVRPVKLDNLDIVEALARATQQAPTWVLGYSLLRREMNAAGWPAKTPEGDRKPSTGEGEPACIDYGDPTGDQAVRFNHLTGDLETIQDHWHVIATSLRAIARITGKHIPLAPVGEPACDVSTCDGIVEQMPKGGYRNLDQIAGYWVVRPGTRAVCAAHRTHERRFGDAA